MKIGKYEITAKWVSLAGGIVIAILIFIFLSIPSCQKPVSTPQQVLNEALSVAKAPLLAQIEDQKKQVSEYKNQLSVSQSKYVNLVSQYVDLEKRKKDVKAPTTNTEIRDRFIALGFTPLGIK